jgi:hypothetical protein
MNFDAGWMEAPFYGRRLHRQVAEKLALQLRWTHRKQWLGKGQLT